MGRQHRSFYSMGTKHINIPHHMHYCVKFDHFQAHALNSIAYFFDKVHNIQMFASCFLNVMTLHVITF